MTLLRCIEKEINKHTDIMRHQTAPFESDVTNSNKNNDETNNINSITDISVENHDNININNGVDNSSTHSNVSFIFIAYIHIMNNNCSELLITIVIIVTQICANTQE